MRRELNTDGTKRVSEGQYVWEGGRVQKKEAPKRSVHYMFD